MFVWLEVDTLTSDFLFCMLQQFRGDICPVFQLWLWLWHWFKGKVRCCASAGVICEINHLNSISWLWKVEGLVPLVVEADGGCGSTQDVTDFTILDIYSYIIEGSLGLSLSISNFVLGLKTLICNWVCSNTIGRKIRQWSRKEWLWQGGITPHCFYTPRIFGICTLKPLFFEMVKYYWWKFRNALLITMFSLPQWKFQLQFKPYFVFLIFCIVCNKKSLAVLLYQWHWIVQIWQEWRYYCYNLYNHCLHRLW